MKYIIVQEETKKLINFRNKNFLVYCDHKSSEQMNKMFHSKEYTLKCASSDKEGLQQHLNGP